MSKTQIRGPQKQGAHLLDTPVAAMVVNSYGANSTEAAKGEGQAAAAAILPLRRALWALAERLVPERLAAALRARSTPGDPTGRDGVRELRLAVADWLDPPPACRWCRRPMRPGEESRACEAAGRRRARPARAAVVVSSRVIRDAGVVHAVEVVSAARRAWSPRRIVECRPSKVRRAAGAVERCGTLALYPAGSVDLATMAAAIACPRGAASGYDVAADRDLRALLAACAPIPPRDVANPDAWADDGAWRLHSAVAEADSRARRPGVPAPVLAALDPLMAARDRNVRTNGRMGIAVQLRYHSPRDGVTRADLTQGAMVGLDRGALDYDPAQARYTTYAAAWARQGCGEAWARRDLVGVPPWVLDLRRAVQDRLHLAGPAAARDLLAAVEALAERTTPEHAHALVDLLLVAEVTDVVPGSRPTRRVRRRLLAGRDPASLAREAASVALPPPGPSLRRALLRSARGSTPRPPWRTKGKAARLAAAAAGGAAESPEQARERLAAWAAGLLGLKTSGSGMLAALRHGAPVFVQVGSGGDDGEDAQGTDGAGGVERAAAVLAAPDDFAEAEDEQEDAHRWGRALAALAALRASGDGDMRGPEMAEVVRRHHGLDSIAEGTQGAGGESFQSIGESGLACSGRTLAKESVRKIYARALEVLRRIAAGQTRPDLGERVDDESTPPAAAPRHAVESALATFNRRRALVVPPAPPAERSEAWDSFRAQADSVAW